MSGPISGTVANMAVLFALCEPGDTITTTALANGAHISTAKFGAVGLRGVKTVNYPWDTKHMIIDVDGARKLLLQAEAEGGAVRAFTVPFPGAAEGAAADTSRRSAAPFGTTPPTSSV